MSGGKNTLAKGGKSAIGININTEPPNKIVNPIPPHNIACRVNTMASLVTNKGMTIAMASTFKRIEEKRAYQCRRNIGALKDPDVLSILFS
tara:strand:+ start:826 stop:1098 length:273 start_codon:yes stop_codon:yes gene_type:complete